MTPPASQRPRLLVLTTTLPARPGDGTPEFVLSLARRMGEELDVTVLAPRVAGAPQRETVDGVRILRFPYFPRRWEGLADGAILPNLRAQPRRWAEVPFLVSSMLVHALLQVRREPPDLVHAHWIVPGGFVAAILRALTGAPYLLSVHGADVYGIRNAAYVRVRDAIVRRAACVLPVSEHLAASLGVFADGRRAAVVPMGVDTTGLPEPAARGARTPGSLLFVGRLAEKKGADVLLRALAEVPRGRLTLVGSGPEEAALRALTAELGLGDRVDFLGQQPKARVLELMHSASALILPSRPSRDGDMEGTPVVLAEGVAAGAPIVASALGGMAERITDRETGLLVEPGSVSALARALSFALSHPDEMERLAANARARLLAELDMRTTAARYLEIARALTAPRCDTISTAG